MRLAICKPFRRISCIPRNELNFSAELNKMIIEFLCKSGHTVDIWTNVSDLDDPYKFYGFKMKLIDVMDNYKNINDYNYDALIIISSSPNFYGGEINEAFLKIYEMANIFKGEVIIYLDDAQLMLKKNINGINSKKSKKREYTELETIIDRPVNIITTFKDFEVHRREKFEYKKEVYFPMEKMYLTLPNKVNDIFYKSVDIGYGGAVKPNRMKYFKKYFLDNPEEIKSEIFFRFKDDQIEKFLSHGNKNNLNIFSVHANGFHFLWQQLNKSWTSPIFGDFSGEAKIIPLRIYQTLYSGCIQLVDREYDIKETIFPQLKDLVYISTKDEMVSKVNTIKQLTKSEYFDIINLQLSNIQLERESIFHELNRKLFEVCGKEYEPITIIEPEKPTVNLDDLF